MAAKHQKAHYTFNNGELDKIGRENLNLLNRLAGVATRRDNKLSTVPPVKSSFEINRMRQARAIEQQNLQLLRRLQTTKSNLAKELGGAPVSLGFTVKKPKFSAPKSHARPPWNDSIASSALEEQHVSKSATVGRPQFKSRDLKDIAMEACREDHLYK